MAKPRVTLKSRLFVIGLTLIVGTLIYIQFPKEVTLSGRTMGTAYVVKAYIPKVVSVATIEKDIETYFTHIDQTFSTYNPNSEISRFNRHQANIPFPISDDFHIVMQLSQRLVQWTNADWDPTIAPLVNRWGFGPDSVSSMPKASQIQQMLHHIGFDNLTLSESTLSKTKEGVALDVSSIAKGFAVDGVADILNNHRAAAFLVEIGGEIKTKGPKPNKHSWKIGINTPRSDAGSDDAIVILTIDNLAVATSGDYRNQQIFENGQKKTHIIHPKTGEPIQTTTVSATVLAKECALADGLATALMVMPLHDGLHLINSIDDVEAMIFTKEKDGTLKKHVSNSWQDQYKKAGKKMSRYI